MLIKGKRSLAYSTKITDIKTIEGADNIELAFVNGWSIIVKKNEFHIGELCIFFEIDSKLPDTDWSSFLEPKGFKIKPYKLSKFNVISEGLVLAYQNFNDEVRNQLPLQEGIDVTDILGVTYIMEEDNVRNSNSTQDRISSFKSRNRKLFKNPVVKFLMLFKFFKYLVAQFVPNKTKTDKGFPTKFEYIHQTDEERVENMTWVLKNKEPFVVTEKLDGTSCTYILERKRRNKFEFYVLSRNVRIKNQEQSCYHSENVYWKLAIKYNIENVLKEYLNKNKLLKYVCIQGEAIGPNVQGNPLKLDELDLYIFNFITSDIGRWDSLIAREVIEYLGMKWVPILEDSYILPDDLEELKIYSDGKSVLNPKVIREGIVIRNSDMKISFKSVSREYLLKKK